MDLWIREMQNENAAMTYKVRNPAYRKDEVSGACHTGYL